MKHLMTTTAVILATTTTAFAGGFDRSGQPIGVIFEDGNHVEFSYGQISPDVSGVAGFDALGNPGPQQSGNVTPDYNQVGLAIKYDVNEKLSFALIKDQPFGAHVHYNTNPLYPAGSPEALVESTGLTALARYKLNENMSVHGGLRYIEVGGYLKNFGAGGYTTNYDADADVGFVLGAAYERPEIALRVALTYSSETDHTLGVAPTNPGGIPASTTDVTLPASINLDFQTGVAADTLVFGSIRYAEWTSTTLNDPNAGSLVSHDNDTFTYSLGVGRRINDNFSAALSFGFEKAQGGTASNLSPTDGNRSIGLGGTYTMDNIEITGGIRYINIGDATTETIGANFSDNSATAFGLKVAYKF